MFGFQPIAFNNTPGLAGPVPCVETSYDPLPQNVYGNVNQPFTYDLKTFTLTGVADNWFVSSGALAPGLSLHPTTGILSGTPTTDGIWNAFIVGVNECTNSSQGVNLYMNIDP